MSLILSGTDGLSDVDGTAATPAIRGTDANTGIFFPAADTIAFAEGGAEVARFDSSGNLGVGTTAPQNKLQVVTTTRPQFSVSYDGTTGLYLEDATNSSWKSWKLSTSFGAGSDLSFVQSTNTSGTPTWAATAAMTLDASGNLGVGTSSSLKALTSASSTPTNYQFTARDTRSTAINVGGGIAFEGNDGTIADRTFGAIIGAKENGTSGNYAGYLAFYTRANGSAPTESARIDSSGNLLVGTASQINIGLGNFYLETNAKRCIETKVNTTAASDHIAFFSPSGQAGQITVTSTVTAYGTSSDYRLKNTIAPMTGALAKVAQLKPCTYKWNADDSDGEGFIAHELAEVCPSAVTGIKDAVDKDGNIKPQGIDVSFLVATLTAAIQEQQALITQLTARITALESA